MKNAEVHLKQVNLRKVLCRSAQGQAGPGRDQRSTFITYAAKIADSTGRNNRTSKSSTIAASGSDRSRSSSPSTFRIRIASSDGSATKIPKLTRSAGGRLDPAAVRATVVSAAVKNSTSRTAADRLVRNTGR